jgi:hypothetical protein
MGLEKEFVARSESELVRMVSEVLVDQEHQRVLEAKVCRNNHVLYASQQSADEWARFLLSAAAPAVRRRRSEVI